MGIRQALKLQRDADAVQAAIADLPIASPWSDSGDLAKIIATDVFGANVLRRVNRQAAMAITAVARARNLLVSTIAQFPLEAYRGADLLEAQPTFLYSTAGPMHPALRLAWTVDDLIFFGTSLWSRTNGADGFPIAADRIGRERWTIDSDLRIHVDGKPVHAGDVILFSGFHEGILTFGLEALDDARKLHAIVRQRLESPVPLVELHQTTEVNMTQEEVDRVVQQWVRARQATNGAVAFTSAAIEANVHTGDDAQLLIEARNAAALDMARLVGVSGSRIDATAPKASLNYETTAGKNLEFVDFDLALYMTPISSRLSMDDIVPRGSRVAFNLDQFTALDPSPTGPNTQD